MRNESKTVLQTRAMTKLKDSWAYPDRNGEIIDGFIFDDDVVEANCNDLYLESVSTSDNDNDDEDDDGGDGQVDDDAPPPPP